MCYYLIYNYVVMFYFFMSLVLLDNISRGKSEKGVSASLLIYT